MAKNINEIIAHYDWEKAGYGDMIKKVREGDEDAVAELANVIRLEPGNMQEIELTKDLYQWLVDKGDSSYQANIEEITRLLDPSLPYSETDVKTYLSWCRKAEPLRFGLLVKALLSDTNLFHRFKAQAMQAYKRMKQVSDNYESDQLEAWHSLLVLDPRSKSSIEQWEDAMDCLQISIDQSNDPFIAARYLDEALRDHQWHDNTWECEPALDCLKRYGRDADFYFYKGVCHLTEGEYQKAKEAFIESEDRRCRLALAYCLIHGFGGEVDHEAARLILKDYPNDAFALYLLAVSLYRTMTDKSQIPPEVTELLEESGRMGYKNADTMLSFIRLAKAFNDSSPEEFQQTLNSFMTEKDVDKAPAIYGGICFIVFNRCLIKMLDSQTEDTYDWDHMNEFFQSEEYEALEDMIETDVDRLTPLAAYSKGLFHRYIVNHPDAEDWLRGIYGFNQSPEARRWGLGNALIIALSEGYEMGTTDILRYMTGLGWSPREVAIWNAALSVNQNQCVPSLKEALRKGFFDIFEEGGNDSLLTLLKASLKVLDALEGNGVDSMREVFKKTEGVTDPLLVYLRNMLIASMGMQNEFETKSDNLPIEDLDPQLMNHFIGYAFFDYKC